MLTPEQLTIPGTEPDRDLKVEAWPRVVVADPPWAFSDKLPGPGRGAEKHYQVAPVDGIVAACVEMLGGLDGWRRWVACQPDATLLLWRVAAMQQEALDVAKCLGFVVKSEVVWLKRTSTGKRHFGMGRQVRMEHEVCLIATRGRGAVVQDRAVRSTFMVCDECDGRGWNVGDCHPRETCGACGGNGLACNEEVVAAALASSPAVVFDDLATRKHSEKPEAFFTGIVERLYEGPYMELFARRQRLGWTCLGDEAHVGCRGGECPRCDAADVKVDG